jgi:hypothetical protein
MDDGDGGYTLDLQAKQYADNATIYRGSSPCPQCGIMVNPIVFMYNKGLCIPCHNRKMSNRVKNGMV